MKSAWDEAPRLKSPCKLVYLFGDWGSLIKKYISRLLWVQAFANSTFLWSVSTVRAIWVDKKVRLKMQFSSCQGHVDACLNMQPCTKMKKIPSELEMAPRYALLTLLTWLILLTWFTVLTLLTVWGQMGFLWEKSLFIISRMADSRIYILKRSYWPGILAPYPKSIFKNSLFSNFHHLDQLLPS